MRRVMIAAYEAEMNVVIYAQQGNMWVTLNTRQIQIEVSDGGPGIPDIDQALRVGFSTAPAAARELGFGAGLGLPNIKKHSDLFEIDSTVGQGTCVRFTIFLEIQEIGGLVSHSLRITEELCCECLHCLHICPTKAMRVRDGRPQILEHLCIDCTACLAACKTGALTVESPDNVQKPSENPVLIVPSAFLVQFGPEIGPKRVLNILNTLGFHEIRMTEGWEVPLHEAVIQYAQEETGLRPVISPVCPAVVNLIETRFPSLIENLAMFLSPVEAAQNELQPQRIEFVAACPSQYTALIRSDFSTNARVMTPSSLFQAVLPLLSTSSSEREQSDMLPEHPRLKEPDPPRVLQVGGIRHVLNILEKAENGLLHDIAVLELFACNQGCFGSPLLKEVPSIARYRWLHSFVEYNPATKAIRRKNPFSPRTGLRLDTDMSKAILKLSEIDRLTRELPGKDCGMCGAPTCSSLAEDIIMGRATKEACVYLAAKDAK